jgi:L-aminopeptidase/D-esterase-like protein
MTPVTWAGFLRLLLKPLEEAILNSLSAADTMEGRDGNTRMGLPVSMVLDILGTWKA